MEELESIEKKEEVVFEVDIMESNVNMREEQLKKHGEIFEELFKAGFEMTEKYFHSNDELLPIFIFFCWKKIVGLEKIENEGMNLNNFLLWCTNLLCAGRDDEERETYKSPKDYLQLLKEKNPTSSACGYVWNKTDMIVTCKNCGMDPTCAICMNCFLAGNHQGHDYNIHKASGGVCDCGDPQAWNPNGFCKNHSGINENLDPKDYLSISLIKSIQGTLRGIFDILAEQIVEYARSVDIDILNRIKVLMLWIKEIQKFGEVFTNMIARELGAPTSILYDSNGKPRTTMDLLVAADLVLLDEIKNLNREIFYKLLPDFMFKRVFLSSLMKHYSQLLMNNLQDKNTNDLLSFTVQLFTVSNIVFDFVKNNNLLNILFGEFIKILNSARVNNLIDCSSVIIEESFYWRVYSDIKYVLTNVAVSRWICYHDYNLFSQFLQAISLIQGCVEHIRKTKLHIEHELPWLLAVNLELWLLRWLEVVLEGFRAGPMSDEENNNPNNNPSIEEVSQLLTLVKSVLELWWANHPTIISKVEILQGYSIVSYDVSSQPVSVQLPLHRVLASFLEISLCYWRMPLDKILELNASSSVSSLRLPFIQMVIEEPLRIQVFMYQIQEKMWVRNGWSMYSLARSYQNSPLYSHKTRQYDLFLLQLAACVMNPEHFFITVLDRFGLAEWFNSGDSKGEDQTKMVEGFITFLLTVLTERTLIGTSEEQKIRRYILHKLCIEDNTHSQLLESLPKNLTKNPNFDKILEEVSIYQAPGIAISSQGMYRIKPEIWEEFEGRNFSFYTVEELQIALGKFHEHYKKMKKKRSFSKLFPLIHNVSLPPSFSELLRIVDSYFLHGVIFYILFKGKQKKPYITEPILNQTLQLLYYCVRTTTGGLNIQEKHFNQQISFTSNDTRTNIKHFISMNGSTESILSLLLQIKQDKDFQEHFSLLDEILSELATIDEESKEIIEEANQSTFGKTEDKEDHEEKERLRKLKERQAALLAQFAAQQKAFQEQFKEEELEDSYKIELEIPECCLCREVKEITENNPIAQICYVENSRSVEITNRINNNKDIKAQRLGTAILIGSPNKEEDETQRNLDHRPGARIYCCGHYMHSECFSRYFSSLLKRFFENQTFEGKGIIDLQLGEFLCPTCRNISNVLLPVISSGEIGNSESKSFSLINWSNKIKEFLNSHPVESTVMSTTIQDVLQVAAVRIYLTLIGKKVLDNEILFSDQNTSFAFWSVIIHTIGNEEIAMRKDDKTLNYSMFSENKKFWIGLFYLVNAAFNHQKNASSRFKKSKFVFWWELLHGMKLEDVLDKSEQICTICSNPAVFRCPKCQDVYFCSKCKTSDFKTHEEKCLLKKEKVPLLSLDLFATFVRMAYTFPTALHFEDLFYLVELFLPVVIMQAIVTIYNSSPEETDFIPEISEEETILGNYLSVVHEVFNFGSEKVPKLKITSLSDTIKSYCLPFLRRAAIFVKALSLDSDFNRSFSQLNGTLDEFSSLISLFKIEGPISAMLQNVPILNWLNDLLTYKTSFKNLSPPYPLHLVPLEYSFEDILSKFNTTACDVCQKIPKTPALCLLCGKFLCVGKCCSDKEGTDCEKHMKYCSEKGLFFLVKDCVVFIARRIETSTAVSGYFAGSLYLDKYGEEDPGFQRGKPLFLDAARYEQLCQMFLSTAALDAEVVKRGNKLYEI